MKTVLFTSVFILLSLTSISQSVSKLDEKYGFREMKFETSLTSFKNLVKVQENFYASTTENLTLGNYKLSQIAYGFYKGRLFSIIIMTKGLTNSSGVLKILQQAYGTGYKDNEYLESYIWRGEKVKMTYEENSITSDATIIMWSKKLWDLKTSEEEKANSEAAKKL